MNYLPYILTLICFVLLLASLLHVRAQVYEILEKINDWMELANKDINELQDKIK